MSRNCFRRYTQTRAESDLRICIEYSKLAVAMSSSSDSETLRAKLRAILGLQLYSLYYYHTAKREDLTESMHVLDEAYDMLSRCGRVCLRLGLFIAGACYICYRQHHLAPDLDAAIFILRRVTESEHAPDDRDLQCHAYLGQFLFEKFWDYGDAKLLDESIFWLSKAKGQLHLSHVLLAAFCCRFVRHGRWDDYTAAAGLWQHTCASSSSGIFYHVLPWSLGMAKLKSFKQYSCDATELNEALQLLTITAQRAPEQHVRACQTHVRLCLAEILLEQSFCDQRNADLYSKARDILADNVYSWNAESCLFYRSLERVHKYRMSQILLRNLRRLTHF